MRSTMITMAAHPNARRRAMSTRSPTEIMRLLSELRGFYSTAKQRGHVYLNVTNIR